MSTTSKEERKRPEPIRICSQENGDDGSTEEEATENNWSLSAQVKVAGTCWLLCATCGMSLWAPNIMSLYYQKKPLYSMASPLGCFVAGLAMDRWGRRPVAMFGAGLFAVGWWVHAAVQNHAMMIAGSLINGYCKGHLTTVAIVVIVEFSDPTTRGPLVVLAGVALVSGTGLAYGLSLCLDHRLVSGLISLLPLSALVVWFFLPESVVWLARKYRMIEARRTLRWVCGATRENQAQIEHEDLMRRRRQDEVEDFQNSAGASTLAAKKWKMLSSPVLRRPLVIGLVLNVAQAVCGSLFLVPSSDTCHIKYDFISELLRLPALLAAALCMLKLNRRCLAVTSGLCMCICALTMGIFHYVQLNNGRPIPARADSIVMLILVLLYIQANSWGLFTLSLLTPCELLPGNVRATLCGVMFAIHDIIVCIASSISYEMCDVLRTYGMLWILATASSLCTIYLYMCLPESRGRSLGRIQDHFRQSSVVRPLEKRHSQNICLTRNGVSL